MVRTQKRTMNTIFWAVSTFEGIRRGAWDGKEYPRCFKNKENNLLFPKWTSFNKECIVQNNYRKNHVYLELGLV